VELHDEAWVESVGNCSLNLQRGDRNQSVRPVPAGAFECVLTEEGWRNVEGLLEPFCESGTSGIQKCWRGGASVGHRNGNPNER
jgi:hypothetical protein